MKIKTLFIESTNLCNARCIFCWYPHMKYPKGYCEPSLVELLMQQLNPETVWLHFAGEPTLHPKLAELADKCNGKAALVTNASNLSTSLAEKLFEAETKWIVNSVVASSPRTYKQVNGLDFNKVCDNISGLFKLREEHAYKTRITNRIVICAENADQIDAMKRFWIPLCDDLHVVKEFRVPKMSHRKVSNSFRLNCVLARKLSTVACVKWDGSVVPCCNDLDAWAILGNAYKTPFEQIYDSLVFKIFRETVVSDKPPLICRNCSIAPSRTFSRIWRVFF